jgi:ribosomal protein S24E
MKITITSRENNPLLKRKEIAFEVNHEKTGGTPARFEVRKELATMLKIDVNLVYLKKVTTKTGTRIAVGLANAYDTPEQAKIVEAKHILARNAPPKKPEEKKEEAETKEEVKTVEKEEKAETTETKEEKKEG